MTDDEPWLPPRAREAAGTLGGSTPSTHSGPDLIDLPPNDPAVLALVSSTPPQAADALPPPPFEDEELTPPPVPDPNAPHILERKEQLREIFNAELAAAAPVKPVEAKVAALEVAVAGLRKDIQNLTAMVKLYLSPPSD